MEKKNKGISKKRAELDAKLKSMPQCSPLNTKLNSSQM